MPGLTINITYQKKTAVFLPARRELKEITYYVDEKILAVGLKIKVISLKIE